MSKIRIPHNWRPRDYQLPAWKYLERGGRHAELVWHRRSGKDDIALHRTCVAAFERPATYWHMLPRANQARKAIWDAINPHTGKRRIDEAFPLGLRTATRENEMFLRFANGATWQVLGSDNYQGSIGSPPAGIVWSEWAQSDPAARGYLRPIIAENNGWQIFVTTPRGKNHAHRTYKAAMENPDSFAQLLTITDTGALSPEQIEIERQEYISTYGPDMGNALFEQEYFCSFESATPGAYFAKHLAIARQEGRVGVVAADPLLTIRLFADIGGTGAKADNFVFWAVQFVGPNVRVLDCYEAQGQEIGHHIGWLHDQGYKPGRAQIWLPHDGRTQDRVYSVSYESAFRAAGYDVTVVANQGVGAAMARIEALRRLFPSLWFNAETCQGGLDALGWYHEKLDENRNIGLGPDHDWSSHCSDAIGLMAIVRSKPDERPKSTVTVIPTRKPMNRMHRRA